MAAHARRRAGPVFFRVALPLARPAIAVGASLALMETLNDVGASEFLGVRTLTLSIYSTWINQSNLAGAAQLALVMLAVVVLLVVVERRRAAWPALRHHRAAHRAAGAAPLRGLAGAAALAAGLLPVLIGFVFPALHLVNQAWIRLDFAGFSPRLIGEAVNTVSISALATRSSSSCLGVVVAYASRPRTAASAAAAAHREPRLRAPGHGGGARPARAARRPRQLHRRRDAGRVSASRPACSSRARWRRSPMPCRRVSSRSRARRGRCRLGQGAARVSTTAPRTLGETVTGRSAGVHLPLIRPALGAAAILVFVDCMKELPATLLLRPLNFETLATHLYGEASRGTCEDGAIAALLIVLVGLLPVILLARVSRPAVPRLAS